MNILQIIDAIGQHDPEIYDRLNPRRAVFKHFGSVGAKTALAALPLAIGSLFQKAYGNTNDTVVGILSYALRLEKLEADFYRQAVAATSTIPGVTVAQLNALTKIKADEDKHVAFLSGISGVTQPADRYDFTGSKGGTVTPVFPTAFTDLATMLAIGQALEDTGVRAYKGRAGELLTLDTSAGKGTLKAALQIHSVEARHASHLRKMRRDLAGASALTPKSWVTGSTGADNGLPAATDAVYGASLTASTVRYPGEANTMQAGIETRGLGTINGQTEGATAAQESFDEALDPASVLAIAGTFIY